MRQLQEHERDFQWSVASDGYLERWEYEQLVYAYQQCAVEGGAALTERALWTSYGTFHFEFRVPNGTRGAIDICTQDFWEPLGPLWSLRHQPSREQIQDANEWLGQCLRNAGEDFPYERPTIEDFDRFRGGGSSLRPSMLQCASEAGAAIGMPNFAGG
jgi:hypothetical protein